MGNNQSRDIFEVPKLYMSTLKPIDATDKYKDNRFDVIFDKENFGDTCNALH